MAATTIPSLPAMTFQAFYSEAANDPYHGDYAAVMRTFRDAAQPHDAASLYNIISALEEHNSGVYLGLFEDPGNECGLSLTFHGVKRFPLTLRRPTQWHKKTFAFIQDVVATELQSVEIDAGYFDRTRDLLTQQSPRPWHVPKSSGKLRPPTNCWGRSPTTTPTRNNAARDA